MSSRDYSAEMDAVLSAAFDEQDCVLAVVAGGVVDKLRVNDPELLAGWLDLHAAALVAEVLRGRLRRQRAVHRTQAAPAAFAEAAALHEAGVPAALSPYEVRFVVDAANTWRRVADMTGADHAFVAAGYRQQERTSAMLAAFHAAVARKVGERTTSAVLSVEEYERLRASIVGPQSSAA